MVAPSSVSIFRGNLAGSTQVTIIVSHRRQAGLSGKMKMLALEAIEDFETASAPCACVAGRLGCDGSRRHAQRLSQ